MDSRERRPRGQPIPPGVIFGLVLHVATGWTALNPEFEAAIEVPDLDERVRLIEDAIRTLLS